MGGCVSSNLLTPTDDSSFSHLTSSSLSQHFVKLTSTTYGLLNLDSSSPSPPSPSSSSSAKSVITPMTPPERFTINGKEAAMMMVKSEPTTEVINFWELMSGLDGDTCRFSPIPVKCNGFSGGLKKENSDPNLKNPNDYEVLKPLDPKLAEESERLCDGGENRVVIYTTSLRGVRRTFEACNAVRAAIESFGVVVCERDVSMDRGFREELSNLMAVESTAAVLPPRVFVKGKYIGGAEEVMRLVEEGLLGELLKEIPRKKDRCGGGCGGCGGLAFLPCSGCNGSCKVVEGWGTDAVVVKCKECNENGLVRCPICS
jgi:glutaredoxin-related protein